MARAIGYDPGTMFVQIAERKDNRISVDIIRNAFVELEASEDVQQILSQNDWQYIEDKGKYYVIGEDALRVAKMLPGKIELRRPMQDGVLNKNEEKKMLVLSSMIEGVIGKSDTNDSVVCFCISSETIDDSQDSTFHKARLEGIVKRLGYTPKVIEEGHAVILSEKPVAVENDGTESPYSGVGVSWGGGKVNCVLTYKGLQVLGMSCKIGGDWIDNKVAEQTGTPLAKVTTVKESKLDFNDIDYDDDVEYALDAYYSQMIKYVFKQFSKKFAEVKSDFDFPLDIVLAGGTSSPNGFRDKVEEVVSGLDLPFQIKEVKQAKDSRNAVAKGCLIQAMLTVKKNSKTKKSNIPESKPKQKIEDDTDMEDVSKLL